MALFLRLVACPTTNQVQISNETMMKKQRPHVFVRGLFFLLDVNLLS